MLTSEAFNALLKTLEEPPSHVVFILCTTEPHKVPSTILSRCLRIQFKKATEEELVRSFERIIGREKLAGEKGALRLIANLSDGSFRDGVKILEEMALIAKNKKITEELVQKNYSIASIQYKVAQMIKIFEEKDIKSGLELVTKLTNEGIEMNYFMQGLIETLHNSMLFKAGVEFTAGNVNLTIDSLKLKVEEIKKLIKLLSEAKIELKHAVLPQIPLELVIVEWGMAKDENLNVNPPVISPSSSEKMSSVNKTFITNVPAKKLEVVNLESNVIQQNIAGYNKNDALWTALVDKVKTYNHSIAGVLRGCSIKSYDSKILILETNFKFHKEKLSEIKTKQILESSLKDVTRKKVEVEIVLKGR
jgi:DNA polymerase-3 subunit gamma/tau